MMPPEHSASSLVEQVPDNAVCPVLAEHAAAIKTLGKRVVGDVIEIGGRAEQVRALLKEEGGWRAWLKAEFVWDRKTATVILSTSLNCLSPRENAFSPQIYPFGRSISSPPLRKLPNPPAMPCSLLPLTANS